MGIAPSPAFEARATATKESVLLREKGSMLDRKSYKRCIGYIIPYSWLK